MKSQTLSWTKIEKSIDKINKDLNRLLSKVDFKIATHNQSNVKGRMIVTIFYETKPGKVRAKCFKDQYHKNLDEKINEFIDSRKVKYVTQSFIGSTIYTVVYYEATQEEIENENYDDVVEVSVDIDDHSDISDNDDDEE